MSLNELSLFCDGSQMPLSSDKQDIVAFNRLYQLPTPHQVKVGIDMNNFKVVTSGSLAISKDTYTSLQVKGLTSNSTFAFFAVLNTIKNVDGVDHQIYSLKEETVQMVVKTLSRISLIFR